MDGGDTLRVKIPFKVSLALISFGQMLPAPKFVPAPAIGDLRLVFSKGLISWRCVPFIA
jgi:hypothetical protein